MRREIAAEIAGKDAEIAALKQQAREREAPTPAVTELVQSEAAAVSSDPLKGTPEPTAVKPEVVRAEAMEAKAAKAEAGKVEGKTTSKRARLSSGNAKAAGEAAAEAAGEATGAAEEACTTKASRTGRAGVRPKRFAA